MLEVFYCLLRYSMNSCRATLKTHVGIEIDLNGSQFVCVGKVVQQLFDHRRLERKIEHS